MIPRLSKAIPYRPKEKFIAYAFVKKAILSCETRDQLSSAHRLINLYTDMYGFDFVIDLYRMHGTKKARLSKFPPGEWKGTVIAGSEFKDVPEPYMIDTIRNTTKYEDKNNDRPPHG